MQQDKVRAKNGHYRLTIKVTSSTVKLTPQLTSIKRGQTGSERKFVKFIDIRDVKYKIKMILKLMEASIKRVGIAKG